MVYVDTSAPVALFTREPESQRVEAWLSSEPAMLVSTDWIAVEFSSAIAAKQRAGLLRPAYVRAAHAAFDALSASGLILMPVSRNAFLRAAALCRPANRGLRAGDALHLAAALEAGAQKLAGLDAAMNAAARKLGINLVL